MHFIHTAKADTTLAAVMLTTKQGSATLSLPPSHSSVQWNCCSFYYGLQLIKDVIKDEQVCLEDVSRRFVANALRLWVYAPMCCFILTPVISGITFASQCKSPVVHSSNHLIKNISLTAHFASQQ